MYEPASNQFLLERLSAGQVFVDIGANIGVFTVPVARQVGPAGTVIAIEPVPAIADYLRRNIALNGLTNVRVNQCAAFKQDVEALPFYQAPADHFGMGALAAQFHAEPIHVPARTLDHILADEEVAKVDLIKIDVEGFEAAVFQGAAGCCQCCSDRRRRPRIHGKVRRTDRERRARKGRIGGDAGVVSDVGRTLIRDRDALGQRDGTINRDLIQAE